MKKPATCISFLLTLFFTTMAVIIWAVIFQLPLMPGILLGLAAGAVIGTWYCHSIIAAKKNRPSNFRECVSINTTILSIILFADLFASMLVWTFVELF